MANWFQRLTATIHREYDRRIRRASQVATYGKQHGSAAQDEEDEGAVEIVNVPRGTVVVPHSSNARHNGTE